MLEGGAMKKRASRRKYSLEFKQNVIESTEQFGMGKAKGICDRTEAVKKIILEKIGKQDCSKVTDKDLKTIISLDFGGSSITNLFLPELKVGDFSGLTSLQELDISDNFLSKLPKGIFSGLTSLRKLSCSRNDLNILQEDVFSGLTSLQELNLSGNYFSSEDLPKGIFLGLTSLRNLDLSVCQLEDLPEGMLSGLTSLQRLDLRYYAFSKKERERIKQELKNADVKILMRVKR